MSAYTINLNTDDTAKLLSLIAETKILLNLMLMRAGHIPPDIMAKARALNNRYKKEISAWQ